jgi:2-methylcitrate dehydratase
MILHAQLKAMGKSSNDIKDIKIRTQNACVEIIDKQGPLHNPADRDHCVQYMVSVPATQDLTLRSLFHSFSGV